MNNAKTLLAIDVGTQSVRAIVFDLAGNILAREQVLIEPYFSSQPGWAEQDPALYWRSVGEACQALWHKHGADPKSLAGVGLTTQRATSVSLDAAGQPLRPAIVWLDQRRAENEKPGACCSNWLVWPTPSPRSRHRPRLTGCGHMSQNSGRKLTSSCCCPVT